MRRFELILKEAACGKEAAGFTLLEVLISVSFLVVLAVTLLQSLTYCLQVSEQAQKRWGDSLSRWNEVQEIRCGQEAEGNPVIVLPGARRMSYRKVPSHTENDDQWGVLSAAK